MNEKSKKSYCLQLRVYAIILITSIMIVITYQSQERPPLGQTTDLSTQK